MAAADRDSRGAVRFCDPRCALAGWSLIACAAAQAGGVAAWLLAAAALGPVAVLAEQTADDTGVVARVGAEPILRSELDAALRGAIGQPSTAPELLQRLQAEALEQLIDQRLLRAELRREGIEVEDQEVDTAVEAARSQFAARGVAIEQVLSRSGVSEQGFRERIALDLGVKRLLAPRLTSSALAATFAKHRRELDGTRVRASHIVLRPDSVPGGGGIAALLARATEIRSDVLQGSLSFAEAARKYSAGPSRHRGGDVGSFPRRGVMVEEFARQAFALAKGEISRPFSTPFGVHLLMVTAIEPGRNDLDSVRPQVEQMLAQETMRTLLADARQRTKIEYEAGVPHFEPAPSDDAADRRIVVGQTMPDRKTPVPSDPVGTVD